MKERTPLVIIGATMLLLSGCALGSGGGGGGGGSEVAAGSLADVGDLDGVELTVGSKEFTEQQVLCEVTAQALESTGATVSRECGMSGSATVRAALESGAVDMYWEYTGTGWLTHLGETDPINDPQELWQTLDEADQEEHGVAWLPPSPANNTYAIAVATELGQELEIATISDYASLANEEASEASFCGAAEFFGRNDGWPGVMEVYGFDLPKEHTAELAAGGVYKANEAQNPWHLGEVFAAEGRIAARDRAEVEDERQLCSPYKPSRS